MLTAYLISILTAIIGIVMIAVTPGIMKVLVIAFGIYLIISGFMTLFQTFKLSDDKSYRVNVCIRSAVSIILGVVCIILAFNVVEAAFKILFIVLGIYAMLAAVSEIITIIKLKELEIPTKQYITELIGTIIASIIFFILSSDFGPKFVKICGVIIIILAIVLAINAWRNQLENDDIIEADAEVVDDE